MGLGTWGGVRSGAGVQVGARLGQGYADKTLKGLRALVELCIPSMAQVIEFCSTEHVRNV